MLCRFTKSLAHRSLMAPVLVPTGRRLVETTAVDPAPPADKPRAAYNKPEISDTIFLKDLTFNAKHGVHAYEKNQAQPFVVSLELKVNSIKAGTSYLHRWCLRGIESFPRAPAYIPTLSHSNLHLSHSHLPVSLGHTDNIDHTVDYSKVYTAVKDVMLSPTPKNLVEHLASSIVSYVSSSGGVRLYFFHTANVQCCLPVHHHV